MSAFFRLESPYRGEYVLHRLSFGSGSPVVAMTGAIHGYEVNGIYALNLVAGVLRMQRPRGTVHLLPCVNVLGAEEGRKRWPFDDRDMNEAFPGSPDGSPVERIAAAVMAATEADLCIDVQSGSSAVSEAPHARVPLSGPALDHAAHIGLPVTWRRSGDKLDVGLLGAWRAAGRTALAVRAGRGGVLDLEDSKTLARGLVRALAGLGMVAAETPPATHPTTEVRDYRSSSGGFFVPEVRTGDRVSAGQLLGLVRAPIGGDPIETIQAERAGFVLGVRVYPMANSRELLLRVAE